MIEDEDFEQPKKTAYSQYKTAEGTYLVFHD